MPSCSIVKCRARRNENEPQLTLHRMPKNEGLGKKWLEAIGEENINPRHKVWHICSRHFDESCFNRTLDVIRLHDNSVPTIFSFQVTITSGPTAQFKQQKPPDPSPMYSQPMIEGIKDESEDPPSDEDTLSIVDGELDVLPSLEQSDEDQVIEALVPLSDAPDPLCDVKEEEDFETEENYGPKEELDIIEEHIGSEEESDRPEDDKYGVVEELSGAIKEENVMEGVNHVGVIRLLDRMPMMEMIPNMPKQIQRRDPEQSIKSITKRCDQALLKVRNMHQTVNQGHTKIRSLERQLERLSCFIRERFGDTMLDDLLGSGPERDAVSEQSYPEMIKQRDEMIMQLQADVESLRNGTRDTSVRQNGAVLPCRIVVPRIKIQSINTEERFKKVNRQLLITKHNDRKKSSIDRQKPVQRTSNSRQKSNQGAPDILRKSLLGIISEIPQKSLAGVKRKVQVQQNSVVPAMSVIPLIGKKRKSDVRQNPSVVIHPKLDIRQMTPISDIPQTSVGLQRTSDIRQNSLVIQIDGMHNTVLQPKLVRLDDNNTELG